MFENNAICKLLGIKYPIFQGGMAWIGTAELASAVSNAGGLGIIGVSFKRGFATITALPGMMLGSKRFMGKFFTAAFMLFIEILITIGFYSLFCELILVVNDAFVSVFN